MKNISTRQGPNDINNKITDDTILEINEYTIQKGNIPITFFLSKTKSFIIIRSVSYELKITQNDFCLITKLMFRTIDEIYQYLKNIFEKKNVIIQDITSKMMKLIVSFYDMNQHSVNKIDIYLKSQKDINGYVLNDLFTKFIKMEENMNNLNEKNKILVEENLKMKEDNYKIKNELVKIKTDLVSMQVQNKKNEIHVNLLMEGIDKINNMIDNIATNNKQKDIQEDDKKSLFSTKSYPNLNTKKNNLYQALNTNYSTKTNPAKFSDSYNDKENPNYEHNLNLNIYGEEQLFRTEDDRVIFRNGLLRGIIKKYSDINNVVNRIQNKIKKGAKFKIVYKATELGDKASVFHQKCDNLQMSLVLIETKKGVRFGGFTTKSWEGNCLQKIDNDAFVFSIDKNKIYDIVTNEPAVGCYPKFGPVFFGCQIRIYDNFFEKKSTTCLRRLNYKTNQDYELNNGEQNFIVKDIEVYDIETIDI
jgi:hypothetical protein